MKQVSETSCDSPTPEEVSSELLKYILNSCFLLYLISIQNNLFYWKISQELLNIIYSINYKNNYILNFIRGNHDENQTVLWIYLKLCYLFVFDIEVAVWERQTEREIEREIDIDHSWAYITKSIDTLYWELYRVFHLLSFKVDKKLWFDLK